ncbi:unnamed protein product [Lactuca saligna]|uniref:Uncharacterized protein n=1 Tax=Lactuca saligna TaxID=75948 RepID=A0AA35ZN94_LACSI|nr:unnamed protein product [Lactuca saligna]
MIIIILKHLTLAILFPPDLDVIEGETRLTTNILRNMHLFHLESNLGVSMPEPDPDSEEDKPIPDATIHDVAAPVQQERVTHPYHDIVFEINTEMVEFREEFYTFRDNQQAHNQHVDSLVTNMHRVLGLGGQPTRPPYYSQYPHYPPPYNP